LALFRRLGGHVESVSPSDFTLVISQPLWAAVTEATGRQHRDEARSRILHGEIAYRDVFKPHLRTETEHT
jgi:hypothetical protein